jgi:L-asparaginase type II
MPYLNDLAEIKAEQFANTASAALSYSDLLNLAKRCTFLLEEEKLTAVVVTCGTDVMEEIAYFLNLTIKSQKPVIVTGAMRPATAISADGPMNLIDAIRVALHEESVNKGVLVVLNDEIHAARDVTKSNAQRVNTFVSRELGPLGIITGDAIDYYRTNLKEHTLSCDFEIDHLSDLPRVDLVTTHIGNDAVAFNAYIEAGAKGIVIAAAGSGAITPQMRDGVEAALQRGLFVVFATRTGSGTVRGNHFYSERLIAAGNINPYKACILLALSLSNSDDTNQIQSWFHRY